MTIRQSNLKLPKRLIEQLGNEDVPQESRKFRPQPRTRKELRKAERDQKKILRAGPPPAKRVKVHHDVTRELFLREPPQSPKDPLMIAVSDLSRPKSILKQTRKSSPGSLRDGTARSASPTNLIPKAVRNKLAKDDEEIAALERKLGLKNSKKLPQAFKDDGLEDLLEGLYDRDDSDVGQNKKSRKEGDEWLNQKRKQAQKLSSQRPVISESELLEGESGDDAYSDASSDVSLGEEGISHNGYVGTGERNRVADFEGFSSAEDVVSEDSSLDEPSPKYRENPYTAPTTGDISSEKYIPPSLRKVVSSDSEELIRLRRRTQGLINRLTESNLISILGEVENLYRDNPRQHVTSSLVDILLTSVCEPTSLPDTLIILPAGFIAAIFKIIGTDFGAQIVQRIVESFDMHYSHALALLQDGTGAPTVNSSKETSNLIMLLSEMYNFQVVGSNLIFDYIRLFLQELSELNAELLLKVIRTSGPQLRQDDPSSLKDIVALLRPAVVNAGEDTLSVRTKFMIETINDLKNNKMKTGGAASAVTSQHTIQMKKIIGTLSNRTIKASEPLRIGLKDIRDSDKKGKWWLVGASWAGNTKGDEESSSTSVSKTTRYDAASDLTELAKEQRMNTDVRRAIFVTILSATDYQDAYQRLIKLKLKKVQEYEIPKVLIHCAGGEQNYNPYYTLIAKKICGDRRLRVAFQYCLWDLFKQMGESEDDDPREDGGDALDMRHLVNLAKMFGTLISDGSLSLSILKSLNMRYLQPKSKIFLEVLFITVMLESQRSSGAKPNDQAVVNIFSKTKDTPQLTRGILYFLRKVVGKTDIAGGKEEKDILTWACKVARDTLESLVVIE